MGADEVGKLKGLTERRAILDRLIVEHRGRIANTAGDSVLAEFGSAVDAVKCAVDAQTALAEANSDLSLDKRISFRSPRNRGMSTRGKLCISGRESARSAYGPKLTSHLPSPMSVIGGEADPVRPWAVPEGYEISGGCPLSALALFRP